MFAVLFALISAIAYIFGVATPITFAIIAAIIVGIQFLIGPKMVEWSMRVKYISYEQNPELHSIVNELAARANIPKPKVGISHVPIPNAFAFGRSKRSARVCVTEKLINDLDRDELMGVLGHELSHIKHRDMIVITALSVIPMICYFIFFSFMFSGMFRTRDEGGLAALAVAAIAFVVYFISNLLVLYASRIREYYADWGSAEITGNSTALASALYKIIRGSIKIKRDDLKRIEGSRAFLASDPSRTRKDIHDLMKADLDKNGRLDSYELERFARDAKVGTTDKIMEMFSTHPNPVRRVAKLAELR